MILLTDIKEANDLLQTYKGAKLQIAFYSESLRRMAIRISLPSEKEVIYILGAGCESINGQFSFSNIDLSIILTVDNEMEISITKISDLKSGFELNTTGGFVLAKGYESEFGTSFVDFFKDHK